jgi:methylase of polypeptide subunit release factors
MPLAVRTDLKASAAPGEPPSMPAPDLALLAIGRELKAENYRFTTITPASHARVNARRRRSETDLTDIFGWNRPFETADLPAKLLDLLQQAGALQPAGKLLRSGVRFSSIGDQLFVHSSFPTNDADSVFFGPDTYRFVRAMRQHLCEDDLKNRVLVDVGCGSGAGGIAIAHTLGNNHRELVLSDLSAKALQFCRINVALNETPRAAVVHSDILKSVGTHPDVIVANPPYLIDPAARLYRNGGGALGCDLSLRIVKESLSRLQPGGTFILYTGAPVIRSVDRFREAVLPLLDGTKHSFVYDEIDPDVFGEELDSEVYCEVDRIALVVLALKVQ